MRRTFAKIFRRLMTSVQPSSAAEAASEPTAAEVVRRASAMIPTLRERAPRCEELRRLPPETVEEFVAAGFHLVTKPKRLGGMGLGPDTVSEVAMEIGRGCGSSGWMSSFWGGHSFEVGWFSEQAQEEYWENPDALSSTASAIVTLDREPTRGGVRLSTRMKFSSGIDYADWVLLQTPQELCLVPKSDFSIDDDWYVSGLRGTGSKTVVLEDVFIPEHRIVANEDVWTGRTTGARLNDGPFYKLPRLQVQTWGIVAPVVGMAQGVVDVFDERVRTRRDPATQQPAFERPGNQLRFAESSAEVDLAREILRRNQRELAAIGGAGDELSLEHRARVRRDQAYVTRLCITAVDRLVSAGDSSALYEVNQLHRLARDTRAGALQFALGWDENSIQYARVRWGLEPQTMLI
jgi:alkylation response protein AidB-like acyl-CoA dehydrogenase